MKRNVAVALFLLLALVQIGVPLATIRTHEDILQNGTPYKFRTAPVDPYDAFRGRYVALNYANTLASTTIQEPLPYGTPVYVRLQTDAENFADFHELSMDPPESGDYLRVFFLYTDYENPGMAQFRLPFDRFFMEESLASRAEEAYREFSNNSADSTVSAHVLVRVKRGRGVIEDLYIRDIPIREFLTREQGAPAR
jgi:uncharacterized membrane-anchored protein